MCGRFTSLTPPEELARIFDSEIAPEVRAESFRDNFNVAPSMRILAVASTRSHGRRIGRLRWGLVPSWSKEIGGTGHVNARSETIGDKPSFRDSFAHRRCIIPMSGYYEWRTVDSENVSAGSRSEESRVKRAVYVTRKNFQPLAVAGLWSVWSGRPSSSDVDSAPTKEVLKTCCVVTRAANPMLATVHDRMPVLLEERHWSAWLGETPALRGELLDILAGDSASADLMMVDVGPLVNSVRNNSPDLIRPIA